MNNCLKNPEIKAFLLKLLIIHIIFTALILIFISSEMSAINKKIVDQNTNIMGQILSRHPELESEIIDTVTKPATAIEIDKGRAVLKSYGYDKNISVSLQPLLSDLRPGFEAGGLTIILAYLILLILLAFFEYRKMYKKVRILSSASEDVMDGNFRALENHNEEGDFAMLTSNFNNMSNRLKLTLESLKEDKLFLKNIISDISHQLKTPLSSLSAINDILLEDKSITSDTSRDFLVKSRSQLDRIEWLIVNLLKMARLEAGAVIFKAESFPVINSVKRAVSSLIYKSQEKKIDINIIGSDSIQLCGDEEWIAEALSNIIKNSIEHTGTGGRITVGLTETSIFTSIVIEDNGEGIDEKDLPHIFERFYKGSNSVKAESVGIGLALCKLIIEAQNGSIYVTSKKGKGSKFTITFLKGVI